MNSDVRAGGSVGSACNYRPKEWSDMNTAVPDQEFLEYLVKSLVDNPADVKVDRKVDEMGVLLTLLVNPVDMGQIIGRQGNTAKAIRSLLRVVGLKNNARVNLKIAEPEGGRGPRYNSEANESMNDAEDPNHEVKDRGMDDVIGDLKL